MKTKILKIEPNDTELDSKLSEASDIIKRGGLVVFPTETVYGIGADATDSSAVSDIFRAKGRPSDNPLIIHISTPSDAEKYTFTDDLYYRLAQRFMPGPLTVVMPSKDTVPLTTRGGLDTVAVRCPENKIANTLIRLSGVPIAAPSANISGTPSPTSAQHVIDDMSGRVDLIIDGGDCDFGLESTIVKINSDSSLTLLRPGKITVEDLEEIGCEVKIAEAVYVKLKEGERAISPGMKYRHYAPKAQVILLDGDFGKRLEYIKGCMTDSVTVIAYDEEVEEIKKELPNVAVYSFGISDDEITQAGRLFKILRDIDKREYKTVYAPLPSKSGVGLALYNRMIRAAAHTVIQL
jgi:L-threonylcarbamoyladenylate synthase